MFSKLVKFDKTFRLQKFFVTLVNLDMQKLECSLQNYEWGKLGAESKVAQLQGKNVEEKKPYAELWMGTHKNGPSKLADGSSTLVDFIKKNNGATAPHENGDLQFLFKILSVGKALSVQVHPTNEQAKELHKNDPKNYPDDKHKPEIAIALTEFELLCGFREAEDLVYHVKANPEIIELFDEELLATILNTSDRQSETLKSIFSSIWNTPQEKISSIIAEVIERIKKDNKHSETQKLMRKLNEQYPGDVGVLAPIFLNYFKLKPGESTFLGPNEPHAYLSGDCIECMACSDNTIRAGLTPKFKDVETLCKSLTYRMSGPPYFKPNEIASGILEYAPPVPEFAVQKITKEASQLTLLNSSSILIVVSGNVNLSSDGSSTKLDTGNVVFIPASLKKVDVQGPSEDFCAYRAYTPLSK